MIIIELKQYLVRTEDHTEIYKNFCNLFNDENADQITTKIITWS